MTDNEIIKALECCGKPYNICVECPMPNNIKDDCRCNEQLAKYALDIINRRQAEIEQWKEEANKYQNLWCTAVDDIEKVKAKVVKDFAERLKENISDDCHIVSDEGEYVGYDCDDVIHCIDNLVKEMIGEQ